FGAGIKWNLKGPWTIGLVLNSRYVFSDFLDGVGKNEYLDYTIVEPMTSNDPADPADWHKRRSSWEALAATSTSTAGSTINYTDLVGTKRGSAGNDFYMTTVFRVTYTFYKWRDPSWK